MQMAPPAALHGQKDAPDAASVTHGSYVLLSLVYVGDSLPAQAGNCQIDLGWEGVQSKLTRADFKAFNPCRTTETARRP